MNLLGNFLSDNNVPTLFRNWRLIPSSSLLGAQNFLEGINNRTSVYFASGKTFKFNISVFIVSCGASLSLPVFLIAQLKLKLTWSESNPLISAQVGNQFFIESQIVTVNGFLRSRSRTKHEDPVTRNSSTMCATGVSGNDNFSSIRIALCLASQAKSCICDAYTLPFVDFYRLPFSIFRFYAVIACYLTRLYLCFKANPRNSLIISKISAIDATC